MWTADTEYVSGRPAYRVSVFHNRRPATHALAIESLVESSEFRDFLSQTLSESPFGAYFWETPPISLRASERPFEFVLTESTALLNIAPDTKAFAKQFLQAEPASEVVVFPNLGGDCTLVAPCPGGSPSAYAHLATFVRSAPLSQQHALWRAVGSAVNSRISEQPVWLSTSGLGVAWLHVRIDSRPKYYSFAPYREE